MANIWWVNHKQTVRQEIEGGYLWSPKRMRNGRRSQYYDFMREARPGDVVVSFANAQIGYHGVVSGFPISAPQPQEFGAVGENWSDNGWLVPVTWAPIANKFRPKDHIDQLRSLLPKTYAPIQANGNGNQAAYLTRIDQPLLDALMQIGAFRPEPTNADTGIGVDEVIIDDMEDRIQRDIERSGDLTETEITAVVKARKGQGLFRRNVEALEPRCRVTGLADRRLLIASHIKPWRACENAHERLDGANGLLLAPHVDKLFDIGLITFEASGAVHVCDTVNREARVCLGLLDAITNGVGGVSEAQSAYLAYHREQVFLSYLAIGLTENEPFKPTW